MEFEKNVEDEHSQSPGAREGMFLPKMSSLWSQGQIKSHLHELSYLTLMLFNLN